MSARIPLKKNRFFRKHGYSIKNSTASRHLALIKAIDDLSHHVDKKIAYRTAIHRLSAVRNKTTEKNPISKKNKAIFSQDVKFLSQSYKRYKNARDRSNKHTVKKTNKRHKKSKKSKARS